jgi:alkylation response protein AidB-like acyl-CoA dehydrogenase
VILNGICVPEDARIDGGAGERMIASGEEAAFIATAADNLGAMQALFDMTLNYAKTREQFGRPIGAFQALQHRLVHTSIAVEEARALGRKVGADPWWHRDDRRTRGRRVR